MTKRMSRTDIMFYAMSIGLTYAEAEDIAHTLSPECRGVSEFHVYRYIDRWIGLNP